MATKKSTKKAPTTDQTIVSNLDNGKDAVVIALVQAHGVSLAKATVIYRKYAEANGLDSKKESMSHKLIAWFVENQQASPEDIQKTGEELGMAKSSVQYYKTMLTLARDVAAKL